MGEVCKTQFYCFARTSLIEIRVYYRRGERSSLGAPDSISESTDSLRSPRSPRSPPTGDSGRTQTPPESHFPLSIYRPRNRPSQRQLQADEISLADESVDHDVYVVRPTRRPLQEPFSPHLRTDRRSQARLSAWKAPSLDDNPNLFSRQNRQIVLFCLGFIFPFGMFLRCRSL
jgi:hypothetical protein